jgi:hypothetical protein
MEYISRETSAAVNEALADVERRTAILRYRRQNGIELRAVNRQLLESAFFSEAAQRDIGEIVVGDQFDQIIADFWSNISSPYRTASVMGHRLDHFTNRVNAVVLLGIQSFCFIQEGYLAPEIGVDIYFNQELREGVEVYVRGNGVLVFADSEVEQVFPESVRKLLCAAVLAHYQDIVCPHITDTDEYEGDTAVISRRTATGTASRRITKRRSHFRRLPHGYKPSQLQLALALCSGRFTREQVETHIRDGGMTYVTEYMRPDKETGYREPRRLVGNAVRFLDIYSRLRI